MKVKKFSYVMDLPVMELMDISLQNKYLCKNERR